MREGQAGAAGGAGLLAALRRLAATGVGLIETRLELLAVELEEERARLVRLAVMYAAGAFFLALGVITFTVFVILVAGDAHRVLAAGLLAAVYLCAGAYLVFNAQAAAAVRSKLFSGSLAELRKDREKLS